MSYEIVKDWITAAGLRAVITMTGRGHHCGYVGIPVGHPLYGCEYHSPCAALVSPGENEQLGNRSAITFILACLDRSRWQAPDMVFDVHGSLTYSDGNGKYPVESDLWWFGYDCAHYGDRPSDARCEQLRKEYPDEPYMWADGDGEFRDVLYCERQCESLAGQIVEKTVVPA